MVWTVIQVGPWTRKVPTKEVSWQQDCFLIVVEAAILEMRCYAVRAGWPSQGQARRVGRAGVSVLEMPAVFGQEGGERARSVEWVLVVLFEDLRRQLLLKKQALERVPWEQ